MTEPPPNDSQLAPNTTRRQFLRSSLAWTIGAAAARTAMGRQPSFACLVSPPTSRPIGPRPRIAKILSDHVIPVRNIEPVILADMLRGGLCTLTGRDRIADAWHALLEPDDTILIKFNQSAATKIETTLPVVRALVKSLTAAGWAPEKITLLEADETARTELHTNAPDIRWQGRPVDFGSAGKDEFTAALEQATAIINVPFLKTHHLATMTCCLKNLSHGLIRHPVRFHDSGCDPAIGQIVASEPIRSRLRLNIVNGLRVVFDNGAEPREKDMHAWGGLILGVDPVACDAVGYAVLNEIRTVRNIPPLLPGVRVPRQLLTASRLGVGQFDAEAINRMDLRI